MIGWIVRILFVLAGAITSWFVAEDALNFEIIQTVIAVLLFTVAVFIIVFRPVIKNWFRALRKK